MCRGRGMVGARERGWGGGLFLRGGGERGGKYGGSGDMCGRVMTFIQFIFF